MKAIGVIPARWGATRFEGKILANLLGKPVIQHILKAGRGDAKMTKEVAAED